MKSLLSSSAADTPTALELIRGMRRDFTMAFVVAGLITVFVNLGLLFVPVYDMILYDRILQSKNMDTLTMLTIGCVAGMVLYGVLEFCRSSVFGVMADRLARRLNLPALQAAVGKSLASEASTGAQVTRDINELRLFVAGPASAIPLDVLWTPALVGVLFLLHPAYGVYGLLCAGILFALSLLTDVWTREDLLEANAATARSLNDLSAALRKSELLEGMGMLPDVARRWHHDQGKVLDLLRLASRRNKACAAVAKATRLAMQAGVIALGVMLVLHNEATPGSMMGSNLLIAKLLLPFDIRDRARRGDRHRRPIRRRQVQPRPSYCRHLSAERRDGALRRRADGRMGEGRVRSPRRLSAAIGVAARRHDPRQHPTHAGRRFGDCGRGGDARRRP